MFEADMTGVKEAGDFSPVPDGVYLLRVDKVEEGTTRKGDNKVVVDLVISNEGVFKGKGVRHNVTFFAPDAPGAGFAKKWLKTVGQPHEGVVSVNPANWRGAVIKARLVTETYENQHGEEREKNSIADMWHVDAEDAPAVGLAPVVEAPKKEKFGTNADKELSEIPF